MRLFTCSASSGVTSTLCIILTCSATLAQQFPLALGTNHVFTIETGSTTKRKTFIFCSFLYFGGGNSTTTSNSIGVARDNVVYTGWFSGTEFGVMKGSLYLGGIAWFCKGSIL
jgi:hypothetical protein